MNMPFITMNGVVPAMYGVNFASNIEWTINRGEQWAVVGANGAGKSLLAEVLLGRTACKGEKIKYNFFDSKPEEYKMQHFPVESIVKVCFESAYSMADYKNMYYQQRFNSTENEDNPT
ncbi:MAG: ATP-binding cassette domain-containing protein, partial [Paludibacteraceae bacterium]|nr:ATP-binding cassette domain-containing protein [Paludibacteraceae bacterium]